MVKLTSILSILIQVGFLGVGYINSKTVDQKGEITKTVNDEMTRLSTVPRKNMFQQFIGPALEEDIVTLDKLLLFSPKAVYSNPRHSKHPDIKKTSVVRPIIDPNCPLEMNLRYKYSKMDNRHLYGSDSLRRPLASTPVDELTIGNVDITKVDDFTLASLLCGEDTTLPQMFYLIESGRIERVHDAFLSTINPGIFTHLSPAHLDRLFSLKPFYMLANWKYFDPIALVKSKYAMKEVFSKSDMSYMCCSILASDFKHINNMQKLSDECLASIFYGEKCKDIDIEFFSDGPLPEYQPIYNKDAMNYLSKNHAIKNDKKLPETTENGNLHTAETILEHLLKIMDPDCFDSLPPKTQVHLWSRYVDSYLNSQIATIERCQHIQEMLDSNPSLERYFKDLKTVGSSSKKTDPITPFAAVSIACVLLLIL